jgi:hypothetical protein
MLHKLLDTLSGQEIISDEKWLPIYQSRKEIKYIGPHEQKTPEVTAEAEVPITKSKKSKK